MFCLHKTAESILVDLTDAEARMPGNVYIPIQHAYACAELHWSASESSSLSLLCCHLMKLPVIFSVAILLIKRFWRFRKSINFLLEVFWSISSFFFLSFCGRTDKVKSHYSGHDIAVAVPFEPFGNRSICFRALHHIRIYGEPFCAWQEIYKRQH